jgi:hypothetical protein
MFLPFLEQGAVQSLFNFNVGDVNAGVENQAARQQKLSVFNCPSHPQPTPFILTGTQCPNGCGTTTYVQSLGNNANYASNNGPFGRRYGARFAEILDGLSNTALFAETRLGPAPGSGSPTTGVVPAGSPMDYNVATNFDWPNTLAGDTVYDPGCDNRNTAAWLYRGKQYYRGITATVYYSHTITPNNKLRDCVRSGVDRIHGGARSYHPGGIQFALGDGSVRFAPNTINELVWRAIGSKGDAEPIANF